MLNDKNRLAACEEIVETGLMMSIKGLVAGVWGNISRRLEDGTVAITPSGCDYKRLTAGDIVITGMNGNVIAGERPPSSELPLHLAVYAVRGDVAAIVHTHSVFASAMAVARRPIPPIIEDLVMVNGDCVAVADYALPGSSQLAINAVAALGDRAAVLLANHGALGTGQTLYEALTICELVEKAAQIYLYASAIGDVQTLSESDCRQLQAAYRQKYRARLNAGRIE
ncbi:MAG: class II aldolase/adducin family protein [Negativicutes bacterium]|nr:class II aldolase/adducin family protein [Negativicutes bacterium]